MKKTKRTKKPRMEDLIPDPERRAEVLAQLAAKSSKSKKKQPKMKYFWV